MIESGICDSAKQEFLSGEHTPNDRYKLALYVEDAALNADTTEYLTKGEVIGTGYKAGGKSLQSPSVRLDKGEASLTFATPLVWEDAWILARGALIYNATKGNKAIAVYNFGTDIISSNGPFTVKIPDEGAIILS